MPVECPVQGRCSGLAGSEKRPATLICQLIHEHWPQHSLSTQCLFPDKLYKVTTLESCARWNDVVKLSNLNLLPQRTLPTIWESLEMALLVVERRQTASWQCTCSSTTRPIANIHVAVDITIKYPWNGVTCNPYFRVSPHIPAIQTVRLNFVKFFWKYAKLAGIKAWLCVWR